MRVHLHVWDRGRAVHRRRGMHRQGQQKAVVRRRPAILLLCRTHISKLGHSRACCLNLVFKKSSKVNNPRENYRPGKWPCRHAFCRQTTPELRTMTPVQISTYIYIPACHQGTFQGALVGWLDPGGHQLICPPLLSAAQGLTLFFLGMTCTSKKRVE